MKDNLFSVQNQVALISGGSRGIGLALAKGFWERGAKVIICGREIETLKKARKKISKDGNNIHCVACDVSNKQEIEEMVKTVINKFGKICTFLNVAGVNKRKKIEDYTAEEYDLILNVNLRGAFFLSQTVGRHMIEKKNGSIINIDSLNTYAPLKGVGPYAISKSGILMMTRAQALEWGEHGVRVNSIAPGFFPTDMTRETWEKDYMMEWATTNTPMKKLGEVEELVGTAIFLGSKASKFVTGQTIRVDGGITAGFNWPLQV